MGKYNVTVEVKTISRELITIEANSCEDAHIKIKQMMKSQEKGYSYLPLDFNESYMIERVVKEDE